MNSSFKILLLLARPGAGKSEVIDFLKHTNFQTRMSQFHVGKLHEIDDFPMLWTWFEEDQILNELGHPRLHTDEKGYFKETYLWDLLIRRISLEYHKYLRDEPNNQEITTLIEFSRGTEHGGYARAFEHLSEEVLKEAAILYIDVSWEESLRKNRRRFNPDRPDSILEHGLSDRKLEKLYKEIDWEEFSANDPKFIHAKGIKVPYIVMNNMDDVTTKGGEALGKRLEESLKKLWKNYQSK